MALDARDGRCDAVSELKEVDPDVPRDSWSGIRARTTDAVRVSLGVFVWRSERLESGAESGVERQLA